MRISSRLWFIVFSLTLSTSSVAQWTRKTDALRYRSEVNSFIFNGKLYAFLGLKDSALSIETSSEVYDPATNTWNLLSTIPTGKEITHQGVVLIDDNVWHIGGRVGRHPGPLTDEIWIYNITNNSWSAGPRLRDPATGDTIKWGAGGAALLGRTLHIFGGFIIDACNHDQAIYHLTLNVDDWLANRSAPAPWKNNLVPLPIKRNHLGTAVLGGKIYAIGGQFGHDCGGGQDQAYAHVYDPVTDKWTQLPLMPTPRSHIEGSTFIIDGKIYIAAGQATNGIGTNKVTIFDPQGNNGAGTWTDNDTYLLPTSYEGLSAKVINNTFIIDHGGEGGSQGARKTTYSRTIVRNPVYKFGFSGGCANLNMSSGSSAKATTLLFTIDGTKDYSISSSASWLKVSKNASGKAGTTGVDIELTANATGLAPGQYSASITATGTGSGQSYTPASYCINLVVSGSSTSNQDTLEAELALLNKAIVSSNQKGYNGTGFVDYINSTGDFIEWTVNKINATAATLNFRYANGSSGDRPLKLEVNGQVIAAALAFPSTGGWATWSTSSIDVNLASGNNKIRLTAIGYSGANIDNLVARTNAGTLEAESAVLNKAVVATNQPGYYGTGFVDYVNSTGDYIQWSLNKSSAGPVSINFRYANGSADNRPLALEVNGQVIVPALAFASTGGWAAWSNSATTTVNLVSGINSIRLTAIGYNGANIDNLNWSEAASASPGTLEAELAFVSQAVVAANQPGYSGTGFVDYVNSSGDFIEWSLDKSSAGQVSLNFRYSNGSANNRPLKLEINGHTVASGLAFNPTGSWSTWATSSITGNLISGLNKIRLTAIGSSGPNVDNLSWANSKPSSSGILEAELAVLHQAVVASTEPGFTGTGYADYINNIVDYIEWSLNKSSSGKAALDFRYANGSSGTRSLKLEINGKVILPALAFPPTGGWSNWGDVILSADLVTGTNTIRLTATGSSGPNVDHLAWSDALSAITAPNNTVQLPVDFAPAFPSGDFFATVAPNPARDNARLFFKTDSDMPIEVIMTDVLGRVHKVISFRNPMLGYEMIPVKKLPAGVYHLMIRQGNRKTAVSFIVEK